MKPRGFTARFTCRALSTARQGLFYVFTFSPFSTLFKQQQKQGGPPLYVERSDVQQLCCSVFSLLRMAGEWVSSSISRGVGNTVTLLFWIWFIVWESIFNPVTNNLKQNKRTVAVNLLFPRLPLYSNNGKTGCQPLYVERGTIFSLVVHWLPFQARRLFVF